MSNFKGLVFTLKVKKIFMRLKGIVVVIFIKVISKFDFDQINISYRNMLLKKHAKPWKAIKNIEKVNDLILFSMMKYLHEN